MKDAASEISTWFTEHEDGEFVRLPVSRPYCITVPSSEMRLVLYTTKPACVLDALEASRHVMSMQVVGRAGLPNGGDAAWLRGLAGGRPVVFLGDADPPDKR